MSSMDIADCKYDENIGECGIQYLLGTRSAFSLVCHLGNGVEAGFAKVGLQAVAAHTALLYPSRVSFALRLQ